MSGSNHIHLWDIPGKYCRRGSKAKKYRDEVLQITYSLSEINTKIQYSAQISSFNIKSITTGDLNPEPQDVFRELREFAYHYENYCYRVFAYREKLMQFTNAIIPLGYHEKDLKIRDIVINPITTSAKLKSLFEKFESGTELSKIIKDRNMLTHRFYYGIEFDHYFRPIIPYSPDENLEFFTHWRKIITNKSKQVSKCSVLVSALNNEFAGRIVNYKSSSYNTPSV